MFRNLNKKIKKVKKKILDVPLSFFFPLHPYMFKSTNNFEKKITYLSRSQRVELVPKISKNLGVNSFHGTLTKTQTKNIICPLGVQLP